MKGHRLTTKHTYVEMPIFMQVEVQVNNTHFTAPIYYLGSYR